MLLESYFDESGDLNEPPGVFVLSGYVLETASAREMEQRWSAALRKFNIPFFHMVDCAHGNRAFKEFSCENRIEIQTHLISLIKKYTTEGFSFIATDDAFDNGNGDSYTQYVEMAVQAMQTFLDANRVNGKVRHFFESGHKSQKKAYSRIAGEIKRRGDSVSFNGKQEAVLLQAADLLAWQVHKYVKDRRSGERAPRADFLSLMEHDHTILYWFKQESERSAAIELWPLSKRSKETRMLTQVDWEGPITLHSESNEAPPLVIVDETVGYRVGGLKTAQVLFRDITKKPFFLSFNEPRLYEALVTLIGATETYKDSEDLQAISAVEARLMQHGDKNLLYVRLEHGAIGFSLSADAANGLKHDFDDE